jgi:protein-export membrane protein SecD
MSAEQALKTTVPLDDDVLYGAKDKLPYLVSRKVAVSGADIIEASATFTGARDEPAVSFRFDARGTRAFADATRENVGRPFTIVLDGAVISAPVIREPILGGSGLINGNFTVHEANNLAILLRSGALPLWFEVVERQAVAAAETN